MNNNHMATLENSELYKSIIKGTLGNIPIIGGVVVELWNYFDASLIDQRLKALEKSIQQQYIDITSFQNKLLGISTDEHKFYAVRNNLKHMLISALPETIDSFNKALIELIMTDNYDMAEYACEIIQQLNADDINFLKLTCSFKKDGKRNHQQEMIQQAQQIEKKQQDPVDSLEANSGYKRKIWFDRNIQFGQNTIFWVDFAQYLGLSKNVADPGRLLNSYCSDKDGNTIADWAYLVRSLTKLQSLGVLVSEINLTLGTTSLSNIDRFHLTFFGQKIITYLDND